MKYDMLVIGMGPAGMALSAMGSAMGLKVLGIEKEKIGGECLNCGCIPSKALLKSAYIRNAVKETEKFGLTKTELPAPLKPFERIHDHIQYINREKTVKMFDKVDLVMGSGGARFIDSKTVEVGGDTYTAEKIYICTGTKPMIPPIPGIDTVDCLTNENLFDLKEMPDSMFIIGGGAIGCEMAQAFSRLGTKITMAHLDPHLLPLADEEAAGLLEEELKKEGIEIYNATAINDVEKEGGYITVKTDKGDFNAEKLLVAAGRRIYTDSLDLKKAGIKRDKKGIITDDYGRTNIKGVWAVGDCNGRYLLSHAAMHQGMLSLINSMIPFRLKYTNYVVPWSVFTEPEVAQAGMTEDQLKKRGIKYEIIKVNYGDYGRTITDEKPVGFVKAAVSPFGKIYGVSIVGESASEIIHEYILAIQKNIRLHSIMLMQHVFPSIALLNKRIAEEWMMRKMNNGFIRRICRYMFRLF
jgi:pyruvate/2-oxoglutarate dehydrogenase complex dihydrolipoamide dehydrogenase (E3) component